MSETRKNGPPILKRSNIKPPRKGATEVPILRLALTKAAYFPACSGYWTETIENMAPIVKEFPKDTTVRLAKARARKRVLLETKARHPNTNIEIEMRRDPRMKVGLRPMRGSIKEPTRQGVKK